jgi:hypothetical protein
MGLPYHPPIGKRPVNGRPEFFSSQSRISIDYATPENPS